MSDNTKRYDDEVDTTQSAVSDLDEKYLTFFMENQRMGIPIKHVEQIVRVQKITPVPELPDYCKGVMDLRGSIIPLIDLRLRFKKPAMEYNDTTAIIVCLVQDTMVGYIVDAVDEVVRLNEDYVSPMPRMSEQGRTDYATGIARLPSGDEHKIILLIDVEKLQSEDDLAVITKELD